MSAFEPAPAAVLRVAGWPLEPLDALADPDLAGRARNLDPADPAALTAYRQAYGHSLEAGRRRLWRDTAQDSRFRAALALASPSLEQRLGRGEMPPRRNKRARHLEKSLYRYLARGASRIEPYGLWTGVTVAGFGAREETCLTPRRARVLPAPELDPFRRLLQALGETPRYRPLIAYRLNPTLQADGPCWRHARRDGRGRVAWRQLPDSPAWQRLAEGLAPLGPATLDNLALALAPVMSPATATALLEFAREAGLLIGGLGLPARFESPWQALEGAETALLEPDRRAWQRARHRSQRVCDWLAARLETLLDDDESADPATAAAPVQRAERALARLLARLARELGLPPPPLPPVLLRCDLGAPFTLTLGQRDRRRLEQLLELWADSEAEHGSGRRYRQRVRYLLDGCGPGARLSAAPRQAGYPEVPPDPRQDHLGPPLGALVLRPGDDGLGRPWLRGLSDVPTATHARHAWHLRAVGDPLTGWFARCYRELARTTGITLADLAYDHPGSPNVLARPAYVAPLLDPWGTDPATPSLIGAELVTGPRPGAVLARIDGRPWAAQAFTAVVLPPGDGVCERLMATGFNWRTELPRGDNPSGEAPGERPERTLADGTVLEPRLTRLEAATVAELTTRREADRFLLWQQLAARHHWPERVRITCGDAPPLLIATASPLALEVAFEGVAARGADGGPTPVTIEVVAEGAWLAGPRGHHLAELVLPVRRRRHLWQPVSLPQPDSRLRSCNLTERRLQYIET